LLGYSGALYKGWFWPYYFVQDLLNLLPWLLFFAFTLLYPTYLRDPEMYIEANTLMSPAHIVPEWYFCAHYEILRAIPNKTLGVLALIRSVLGPAFLALVPRTFPLLTNFHKVLVNSLLVVVSLLC
jgi:quinol-cytochrome oxidoreductase complex cytochrome b subunit